MSVRSLLLAAAAAVVLVPLPARAGGPLLGGRQDLAVGVVPYAEIDPVAGNLERTPFSAGLGDVDGDGDLDVVAAAQSADFLSTFLNLDGEALFAPVPSDAVGAGLNPRALVLGDVNGDGRADAMVTFQGENAVGVCLSSGSAPWFPAASFTKLPVQRNPSALEWADVNGDAVRDLVVLNRDSGTATVFQGAAGGTFTLRGHVTTGAATSSPTDLAVLDDDGDGDAEIYVTDSAPGQLARVRNQGGFSFGAPSVVATVDDPACVTAGRLDGGAELDLVVAARGTTEIALFLGTGSGGMTPAGTLPLGAGAAPEWAALGDMDGDGLTDVVATTAGASVAVILQDGAGPSFAAPAPFATGEGASEVVLGDFDGDTLLDAVTANPGAHDVSVHRNRGDGLLVAGHEESTQAAAGGSGGPVALGSGQGDAEPGLELVSANRGATSSDGTLLRNDGSGNFISPTEPGGATVQLAVADGVTSMAYADLDGDGLAELVSGGSDAGAGTLRVARGSGGVVNPGAAGTVEIADLELALVDGDARLDLLALDAGDPGAGVAGKLLYLRGNGGPSLFDAAVALPLPMIGTTSDPRALATGELDGQTGVDAAVLYRGDARVVVLVNGGGTLVAGPAPTSYAMGKAPSGNLPAPKPTDVAIGDVDADGDGDLAVADPAQNVVSILPNGGGALFTGSQTFLGPRHGVCTRVLLEALDADARADVVTTNLADENLSIFLATAAGFAAPQSTGVTGQPEGILAFDRDGDGDRDLAVAELQVERVVIFDGSARVPRVLVTAPGPDPANPAAVRLWRTDGVELAGQGFVAYQTPAPYGANVAAADLDGDAAGIEEIYTGPGPSPLAPARVRGFGPAGNPGIVDYVAYAGGGYGVNAHGAQLDADAEAELVTGPGPGEVYGPHVRGWQWSGTATPASMGKINYFAYGTLKFGVNVASGDVDRDGFDEIVTGAGPGAVFGPHVRGWNVDGGALGQIAKINFFAYGTLKYGVNPRGLDVDGDGYGELVTGPGPGSVFGPVLRGFNYDGSSLASMAKINASVFATYRFGLNVGGADMERDGFDEILAGAGDDPAAPAQVQAFNFDATKLQPVTTLGFDAHPGLTYGVNVAGADLGRYGQ